MKIFKISVLLIVIAFVAGVIIYAPRIKNGDALYQVSTLNGLMRGDYDGKVTLREIAGNGDFGLGTFDRLDGEAIELYGIFYQVKSDGTVRRMGGNAKSPFAMATFFNADARYLIIEKPDFASLRGFIDSRLPTKNIPYAVKIEGKFNYIRVRSVPAQNKPYPLFAEVASHQTFFEFRDIEGTLIGFRMPDYMAGINVGGYHLHFLSQDKTKGGHVLECAVGEAQAEIDDIKRFVMVLRQSPYFNGLDLSVADEAALKAEKSK
ncbi:MAG: acetolactate decarboxylase [Candidatus Omnitrophota bacterium]